MFESLFKRYQRIIFFDTETTGLTPEKGDQIIELAAIALDPDASQQCMDQFIKLETLPQLPQSIINLTGITDWMLFDQGVEESAAIAEFMDLIKEKTLLIAHNAQFDLLFLAYSLLRHRDDDREKFKAYMQRFNSCDYLDTLTVYRDRRLYPHKLENAIREYGLAGKVENSHRAIDDCKALFNVTKRMEEERSDLIQYVNLFGYNPKYGPSGKQFKKIVYRPQMVYRTNFNNKLYDLEEGDSNRHA